MSRRFDFGAFASALATSGLVRVFLGWIVSAFAGWLVYMYFRGEPMANKVLEDMARAIWRNDLWTWRCVHASVSEEKDEDRVLAKAWDACADPWLLGVVAGIAHRHAPELPVKGRVVLEYSIALPDVSAADGSSRLEEIVCDKIAMTAPRRWSLVTGEKVKAISRRHAAKRLKRRVSCPTLAQIEARLASAPTAAPDVIESS